jgi:hypothetical protein
VVGDPAVTVTLVWPARMVAGFGLNQDELPPKSFLPVIVTSFSAADETVNSKGWPEVIVPTTVTVVKLTDAITDSFN